MKIHVVLALILIASPVFAVTETTESEPTPNLVLILKQEKCCGATAWPEGEEALIRELQLIGTFETKTVDAQMPTDDPRYELSVAAVKEEAEVVVRMMLIGDEILVHIVSWSRGGDTVLFEQKFEQAEVSTPEQLSAAILQIVETVLAGLVEISPLKPEPEKIKTDGQPPKPEPGKPAKKRYAGEEGGKE